MKKKSDMAKKANNRLLHTIESSVDFHDAGQQVDKLLAMLPHASLKRRAILRKKIAAHCAVMAGVVSKGLGLR